MIDRHRRTRILIEGDRGLAPGLSARIRESHSVSTLEEPNEGLVMVRMRESAKNGSFNLGEVLVTEAKALMGETIGIGIVVGHEPELALSLAVIDAAFAAGIPECAAIEADLLAEEARIAGRDSSEAAAILKTRVDFQTMDTCGANK